MACVLAALALLAAPEPVSGQTLGQLAARADGAKTDAVFDSVEFRADSASELPQWKRVVAAIDRQLAELQRCMDDDDTCADSHLESWRTAVVAAQDLPVEQQLRVVNRYFNRWSYRTDSETYDQREYWASPLEFLANAGDCEDYAIIKFATLLHLGVPENRMRIVVIFDRIRQIRHAVLAYYHDNRTMILDSLSDYIFEDTRYTHYRPEYSVTMTERWTHVPVRQ